MQIFESSEIRNSNVMVKMGMNVKAHIHNGNSAILKADITCKTHSSKTVWDIINEISQNYPNYKRNSGEAKEFRNEVERRLLNKFFILSYSSKSERIHELEWNESESSTFVF